MRLSWRVPFAVTLAIGSMAALNSLWSARSVQKMMAEQRRGAIERLASQFRGATQNFGNQAASVASIFAEMPTVLESLKTGDRRALATAVVPPYKVLHEKFGFSVLALIGNDAKIFFRAHNPEKYGDDASSRELITSTLQRKIAQSGIEVGNSGVSVRGILPVGANGAEGGLVEVAIPFDRILNSVAEQTGFDIGIYLDAKLAGKLDGRSVGGFKEIATTNARKMKEAAPDGSIDLVQEVTTSISDIDGESYGTVKMPLLDFANQNIGTIIGIRSFAAFQKQEREAYFQLIIQAILMTVAGAGVINIAFAGLVMRPIQSLNRGLNGQDEEVKKLTIRGDEIGEIARKVLKEAA